MNPVICLITNRYIVPLLASMLIFNSKGSQSRCLSCNRIKRKTDCSLASGYIYHKIPFSLSRKKNGNFERKGGGRKLRSVFFCSPNLLSSNGNFNLLFAMEFLESSITLSQSSRSEGVKIFLVVFIERLKEEKIPPS